VKENYPVLLTFSKNAFGGIAVKEDVILNAIIIFK
jgi:hypothetical protein